MLVTAGAGIGALIVTLRRASPALAAVGLVGIAGWWGSKVPWATLDRFAPVEQTGPLVRHLEENWETDDTLAVYYSNAFALAYYSSQPRHLEPTKLNTLGFYVQFDQPHVVLLPAHRGDNAAYDPEIRRIVTQANRGRIWFLLTHAYGDEASYLVAGFGRQGRIVEDLRNPNAELLLVVPN